MNKDSAYVLGCYILWGILPVFWKLLAEVDSFYVLAQRIIFSCIFCYLIICAKRNRGELGRMLADAHDRRVFLACGLLISVNWGVYILTIAMGRILEASLAYYMNPLFSVLIGAMFFRERLSAAQWVSIALAFTGVMISVIGYGSVPYFAIIIGLSFALYGAIKKGVKAQSEVSTCVETMMVTPLALAFIVYAQVSGYTTYQSLSLTEILLLAMTGIVTSVPLLLFSKGIKNTSIVTSGILMYINPTLQLLIGVLVYGEEFTKTSAITFAFVWAAVILFVFDSLKRHKRQEKPLP